MHCGVCLVGTGKSTLVKYLIDDLKINSKDIAYAAYTGKAALVLQQKGQNAVTLHKLLYNSFKNKEGVFVHVPKEELDEDYKLIVIDEISMCPKEIWELALRHKVHIIALGDPFQLPAIGEDNGVLKNPHVFLDEVMRQALESDIIKLSMDIRAGKPLKPMNGNDVKVICQDQVVSGMYTWADQILCGKNATRRTINNQMRNLLGYGAEPQEGDKIICLKNYWDISSEAGDSLVNGMIGTLVNPKLGEDGGVAGRKMQGSFLPDFADESAPFDSVFRDLDMDYRLMTEGIATHVKDANPPQKSKPWQKPMYLKEFDYGYAITCWKAQGSQFGNVLFFGERLWKMSDIDYLRYLYTGITRAIHKIVIVLPYSSSSF